MNNNEIREIDGTLERVRPMGKTLLDEIITAQTDLK
jgi:hypothetical protein